MSDKKIDNDDWIKCERCGGTNIYMTVSLMFKMPAKYENHITKKVLAKKETQLMAANWDRVIYYCEDCHKRQMKG